MKDGRSQRPADTKKRPIKEASEVLEDETVSIPTPRGVIFLSSIQGERRKQAKTQCLKISQIVSFVINIIILAKLVRKLKHLGMKIEMGYFRMFSNSVKKIPICNAVVA